MADAAASKTFVARAWGFALSHIPTREGIERNRFLRPVAHRILHPVLWRFTRRSVPRGVALGVVSGILFPFVHAPVAALSALPVRANVPVAVATTLLHNPLTSVPLYFSAYRIGCWILHWDRTIPGRPIASNVAAHASWFHTLVAQVGPATIVGLVVMSAVLAAIGYVAAGLVWRIRIGRKWRQRTLRRNFVNPFD
ncbi:DUF2062 domain-containing protein [Sphingomonas sp. PAMC 26617]|uniref:DUF2062 domain-containing protein n=1 Tax=Sphingomonas sp. PAMC 26617 TaxID=1112216 RepID=UPI0002889C3C|nr:DUF2062 domain-containing protein [Sphingomonas sp. PAMC 26617]